MYFVRSMGCCTSKNTTNDTDFFEFIMDNPPPYVEIDEVNQNHTETGECCICGTKTNMKCKGCKKTYYCSRECQKIDWNNGHKHTCKTRASIIIRTDVTTMVTYI